MPVRIGGYVITAQLTGFVTVTRRGVELLVGQTAAINLQMALSGVAEAVTVTAETPLVNTATSNLGGNVDPRQVQELPVAQRNWMGLALLAPGSRTTSTNSTGAAAGPARRRHARVSTERRRPAGVVGTGRRQSAALQPGLDRRVPVHREPVRRHHRPLDGRAGERHHEVRHQQVLGAVPHQFPEQQLQRARSDRQQGAPDQRSAVQHGGRRSDSSRTSCITSSTTRTSSTR